MPSITQNQDTNSISKSFECFSTQDTDSISKSLEYLSHSEIGKYIDELQGLRSKTDQDKKFVFNKVISCLNGEDGSYNINELFRDLEDLKAKLDSKDAELNDAHNLDDLQTKQIAGFNKEKLLEMCVLSKIAYGDVDRKLIKNKCKTKREFEKEGYKIIQFYDNELIQDKYCSDSDYKLEQHNVGYALTGSNSYNRDAGYVFIKDKEVTIAYHGTRDLNDVREDLRASLISLSFLSKDDCVHSGFYSLFKRSWPSVHKILQGHANDKRLAIKDLKINVTGHSMGGALASIAALCLNKTEDVEDIHVATFGSPRVFYNDAAKVYSECLGEKSIRVACQSDPVPCLPHGNGNTSYKHVGKPLKLETGKTVDYLDPGYHKLDTYFDLIENMGVKEFEPDNNVSKYYYIARAFGLFYRAMNLLFTNVDNSNFFEEVKNADKNILLSQIPIERAPRLEERFKQREQEVTHLTDQKIQLEKKLTQEQQKTSEFRNQVDKLTGTEGHLTEENKILRVHLKKLKALLEQNETELKKKIEELNSTRQKLNSQTNRITKLEEEVGSAKKALMDAQTQLKENKKLLDTERKDVLQLKEDLKQVRLDLAAKIKEFENTKIQLKKLEQGLDDKTSEVIQLTGEKSHLEEQLDSVQKELTGKISEVIKLAEEKDQLEKKLDSTKQELNKKTQELKSAEDQLIGKEKVNKLKDETQQLEELKSTNEGKIQQLESQVKELKALKSENEKLEDQITQLNKELEEIKAQFAEKEKEVSKLPDLEKQINDLGGKVAKLTEELKGKDAQLAEKEEELEYIRTTPNRLALLLRDSYAEFKQTRQNNLCQSSDQSRTFDYSEDLPSYESYASSGDEWDDKPDNVHSIQETIQNSQIEFPSNLEEEIGLTLTPRVRREDELQETKAQLERKEEELNRARQDLATLQESLKQEGQKNSKQQRIIDDLTENKDLLSSRFDGFRSRSNQSRKQSNCASAAFVIAGAFTVGASLATPYLAVCITFAVVASISLIAGVYCLYKANTALSDVKADQIGANVGANIVA